MIHNNFISTSEFCNHWLQCKSNDFEGFELDEYYWFEPNEETQSATVANECDKQGTTVSFEDLYSNFVMTDFCQN